MLTICRRTLLAFALALAALALLPGAASAGHGGSAHWARSSNPFTVRLGDNVSAAWDPFLAVSAADWSASSVLDTVVVAGGTSPKTCRPTLGRVEVCSATYGNTGWISLEQLWTSGGHITQATVKLNDTYFNNPPYNGAATRQSFMCHGIGRSLGLGNQASNSGSCMGDLSAQHPNAHDYEELEAMYAHLDLAGAAAPGSRMPEAMVDLDLGRPRDWGRLVKTLDEGRVTVYRLDFGGGNRVYTTVTWAQ